MTGPPVVDVGCVGFLDHLAFHLHVDLEVDMDGIDIRVSVPVADHVDVVSRAQQLHCGSMAKVCGVTVLVLIAGY